MTMPMAIVLGIGIGALFGGIGCVVYAERLCARARHELDVAHRLSHETVLREARRVALTFRGGA